MRLTTLNPVWYGWYASGGIIGVRFNCPVCVGARAHFCCVPFANPIEGLPEQRKHLWQRTGETFDTLTLSPSVDYTRYDNGESRDANCWHGHIVNGEVT